MKFFRRSCFLLVALMATNAKGLRWLSNEKSCDLDCPRNAPCRFCDADFSGRTGILASGMETHRDGMHCDCPVGWTGILCDQKYETCTNQNGHECYNGGECILGLQDKYGNEQLFCDCSNAKGYVGKYCETPFAQTCGEEDIFCVNGGACNPDFPKLSSEPCFCDEGWEGYHCEYKKSQVPECSLDCQNGGTCFLGAGGESRGKAGNHRWSLDDSNEHMFCMCPPGFGGRFCEAPAELCGEENGHFCLNGGTCVTTSFEASNGMDQKRHHCDCTTSTNEDDDYFAGKYCEHRATSICGNSGWDTFFCTQGGTCKSNLMEGCSCRDGTTGFKCEFAAAGSDQNTISSVPNKNQDNVENYHNGDMMFDNDDNSYDNKNNKLETACGDGYCLNGGNCVTEEFTMQDGFSDTKEYCDCSEAYDANSNYAGVFCQYKSTSLCLVENALKNSMDSTFCVHHGVCQEDGSCDCPSGWTGQYCELKALDPNGDAGSRVGSDNDSGEDYIEVDECGSRTCYNGGVCVEAESLQSNGDLLVETYCDCSAAFDEKYLYAGLSCEFPSTQICSIPQGGNNLSGSTFCTNHGICRDKFELGCDCPLGFFGPACEYEIHEHGGTFDQMEEDDDDGNEWEICGDGICHHGGTCITSRTYNEESGTFENTFSCDCSTAYDDDTAYLGASCEYPSTTICVPPKSGESLSSARFCVNHGTCSQDPSKDCECRDGFEGSFCQFKIDLDQIDEDDTGGYIQEFELCGEELICYNGGKCVTTTISSDKDSETFEVRKCDCDSASNGVEFFAGSSCEYKATSLCSTSTKASFCVNGGKCQESEVCHCELPWKGSHCEFPFDTEDPYSHHVESSNNRASDEDMLVTECNLKCKNGGVCVQGAKDLSVYRDSIKNVAHLNQTYAEDQFAHCACADGWIGLTCENRVEICGDNQHFCLHGSKCVSDMNADRGFSCDCSHANDTVQGKNKVHTFAGDACQFVDMDICTIGNEYLGQPLYFCVNGGSCNAKVHGDVSDPGCRCPGNFAGPHCEVRLASGQKSETSAEVNRLIFITALLIPLFGMLVFVASYTRSLLLAGRKSEAVITDNGVPITRTPFSPRRRRRKGFATGSPSNPKPFFSDTHVPSSSPFDNSDDCDIDATASAEHTGDNTEGIMSDCCLEGESPSYDNYQEEDLVQNRTVNNVATLRGSHFV